MRIITRRLILRPWRLTDAKKLFALCRDPLVGPAAGFNPHKSVADSRDILKRILITDSSYAVVLKKGRTLAGCISLSRGDMCTGDREAELGYWLGSAYWGNGYMPEAASALIEDGFTRMGLSALWCGYFEGNEKSKRVGEKCGFSPVRVKYDKPWKAMNKTVTEYVTRLTYDEWREKSGV